MSLRASAMLLLYRMGRITEAAVRQAVEDGIFTEAEAELILGLE